MPGQQKQALPSRTPVPPSHMLLLLAPHMQHPWWPSRTLELPASQPHIQQPRALLVPRSQLPSGTRVQGHTRDILVQARQPRQARQLLQLRWRRLGLGHTWEQWVRHLHHLHHPLGTSGCLASGTRQHP